MKTKRTKTINSFDNTKRKIRCIANKHDYLGDGTLFIEPELEINKEYTLIKVQQKSYGTMVFLKEIPTRRGFQSYLFEELTAHDENVFKKKCEDFLLAELKKSEENTITYKSLSELHEKLINKKFIPTFTKQHNYDNAYWILPIKITNKEKIHFNYEELSEFEISIESEYFELLLLDFFISCFNNNLDINRHRISTDFLPEGEFIEGFAWDLNPNFYTQKDITNILELISIFKKDLSNSIIELPTSKSSSKLKKRLEYAILKENISKEELYSKIIKFYDDISIKIIEMFNHSNTIAVIAP